MPLYKYKQSRNFHALLFFFYFLQRDRVYCRQVYNLIMPNIFIVCFLILSCVVICGLSQKPYKIVLCV